MRTVIPQGLAIVNKWPQMLVTGKSVTPEQAMDIIYRTDNCLTAFSEYGWGNNHKWNKWAMQILGYDLITKMQEKKGFNERLKVIYKIREKMNMIVTEYVTNDWASCCFIGGPHGWCHPDGKIQYTDNIGKWPDLATVIKEWETLQDAFPYIDLAVTLMDKEDSEEDKKPIISFLVKDGKITFTTEHDKIHQPYDHTDKSEIFMESFRNPKREQGLPDKWIVDLGKKMKPVIEVELAKI